MGGPATGLPPLLWTIPNRRTVLARMGKIFCGLRNLGSANSGASAVQFPEYRARRMVQMRKIMAVSAVAAAAAILISPSASAGSRASSATYRLRASMTPQQVVTQFANLLP